MRASLVHHFQFVCLICCIGNFDSGLKGYYKELDMLTLYSSVIKKGFKLFLSSFDDIAEIQIISGSPAFQKRILRFSKLFW